MSIQEVEDVRMAALLLARQLQDGKGSLPAFARGRSMTLDELHQEFLADLQETKGEVLRQETLRMYGECLATPSAARAGNLTLPRITVEVVRQIKRDIPAQVVASRPHVKGGGRLVANMALQQLGAALDFACRMEWTSRNVASARLVPRYEKHRSEKFLDAQGYAAVGRVLRDLEVRHAEGGKRSMPLRTLLALRVTIYTGVRHRSELLSTLLEWC